MPSFSKKSFDNLRECHEDIQKIFIEAIQVFDFSVICGRRTHSEQFALYTKGRKQDGENWVKTGATVTNCDGVNKESKHNYYPSVAVDVVPYPVDWDNINRFFRLAGIVQSIAYRLKKQGDIKHRIKWGGDWKSLKDYPHFELIGVKKT